MSWWKKEPVTPDYLNNEQEFVKSASMAQRKAFIKEYENRFWSGFTKRYKWETSQNLTFMDKLKREPDLLEKYEAERRGVIGETRTNLLSFQKTTQAGIDSVNEYKRKASAGEVTRIGWEAKNKLDRETQFKDINNRLFDAWAQDLDGGLFDNGLIGALTKPSSKLNKALLGVERDYGTEVRRNIEINLAQYRNIMMQVEWASKGQQWAMSALLSPFGYKNQEQILQTMTNSQYIKNDIKGRLPAIASTLLVLGVSSALGNPTLYLGNLKLPFSIKSAQSPSKDIAAYALFGTSARIIENDANKAIGRYVEKNAKLTESETKKNRWNIDYVLGSLDPNIDVNAHEAAYQAAARTSRLRIFRQADLRRIANPNVDDYSKYGILVKNPDLIQQPEFRRVQRDILYKYWLNFEKNASGWVLELGKLLSRYTTAQEFIESHVIPDPRIAKYIEQFYKTLDGKILYQIVHGADTPGAVAMINAYTRRWGELSGYLNVMNNRTTVSVDRRSNKYAGNINSIIWNRNTVADYLQNTAVNGMPLENTYSKQISQLTGIDWAPQYIVNQIRTNGVYVANFPGVNTARNQLDAKRINYTWGALVTAIGCRKDGQHGYQLIGIKWDCANIVVGEWFPDDEFTDNGRINIPARIPLAISKSWFDHPKKKTPETPEKPQPHTPTPEAPRPYTPTPEAPRPYNPPFHTNPGNTPGTWEFPESPTGWWINPGSDIPTHWPIIITPDPIS